ncbi:MAG: hypothetical protein EZS28_010706 [Streblomastix strix]|uniref:Uncharacterized protein n=1 Tax=Streblomastix strix TaxID=222440 RepID=A0A5J4WHJ9_9EUKA|nr:MAG: hypothetical protein EZS28_010706 [Streblomastix strix]
MYILRNRKSDVIIELIIGQEQCGSGGRYGASEMENDIEEDDYDYYESQAATQDRVKSRAKPFEILLFNPSLIQRTRMHGGLQFRVEEEDVLATLVDLDDNETTPDNVVVYDKKNNAIYSVDGYSTAIGIMRERQSLVVSEHSPSMQKKVIDANGGAKLPMATKQQTMASAWNSVLIGPAVDVLEKQDGKIDIYNRSNKTKIEQGQYEYLPIAKRIGGYDLVKSNSQIINESINESINKTTNEAVINFSNNLVIYPYGHSFL